MCDDDADQGGACARICITGTLLNTTQGLRERSIPRDAEETSVQLPKTRKTYKRQEKHTRKLVVFQATNCRVTTQIQGYQSSGFSIIFS